MEEKKPVIEFKNVSFTYSGKNTVPALKKY